jgi:hypothetical protein
VSSTDIVLEFLRLFDQLAIPYMLVGSYSSNYYGRPRSTKDADFVLQIADEQLHRLRSSLPAHYHFDRQLSFETVTMTQRYIVTHPASAFKIELFLLTDDPHDRLRFERKQAMDFEGTTAWLPTAEDVIVQKLRWSKGGKRAKDVDDASKVLAVQTPANLDLPYIRHWTDQHKTRDLFEKLLAETPKI